MALMIPVNRGRWLDRVRIAYRNARRLRMPIMTAITEAMESSFAGSWLDIRSWRIWR